MSMVANDGIKMIRELNDAHHFARAGHHWNFGPP
jgi:hypothetical protein